VGGAQPKARTASHNHRRRPQFAPDLLPFNLLKSAGADAARSCSRAPIARKLREEPVYVRGRGGTEHVSLTQMKNLTFSEATKMSSPRPSIRRGHKTSHLMFYDAFTSGPRSCSSHPLCKPGEGVASSSRASQLRARCPSTQRRRLSYTHLRGRIAASWRAAS